MPTPRPRPTTSCLVCRKRKIKCDRIHPACNRCLTQGLKCEYAAPGNKIRFVESPHSGSAAGRCSESPEPQSDNSPIANDSLERSQRLDAYNNDRFAGTYWDIGSDGNSGGAHSILQDAFTGPSVLIPVESVMFSLPSRYEADRLFAAYTSSVHPIFPLLDLSVLHTSYETLWLRATIDLTELLIIIAVLYHGSVCTPSNYGPSISRLYLDLVEQSSFATHPTLGQLQAFTIYNTANANEALPLSSFAFLPQAIRAAQAMGLHTEPSNEGRRRMWWHLVYLDIEASIGNGLPRMIHPGEYDTLFPTLPELPVSYALALQARWEWSTRMQCWLRNPPTDNEIVAFNSRCEEHARQAAEHDDWCAGYIRMIVPRALCILRLRSQNPPHTAAERMLDLYLQLAGLQTHQWFLPGLLHPLHATIILLLKLSNGPPCLRSKALLDETFALVGNTVIGGVLTPRYKGPSADGTLWIHCLLGKLRAKVWAKARWTMLYGSLSEQQQHHYQQQRFCKYPEDDTGVSRVSDADLSNAGFRLSPTVPAQSQGLPHQHQQPFDWEEWDRMVSRFFPIPATEDLGIAFDQQHHVHAHAAGGYDIASY